MLSKKNRDKKGRFVEKHTPHNFRGEGYKQIVSKGEKKEIYISSKEHSIVKTSRGKKYLTRKRLTYAQFLWMNEYGKLPKDQIIYNKSNKVVDEINIKDLIAITRAELLQINKQKRK